MSQPTQEKSLRYFQELTYEALIEVDEETLTDEELRSYLEVIRKDTRSPQTKRSKAVKASNKLSGKAIDVSKFL